MINPIAGLPQPQTALNPDLGAKPETGDTPDFMETLRGAISQVGQLQSEADAKVAGMLDGNGQDVHSAMIAAEKASLAFELMVEVRNKIVSAYQEVSRIPF